MGSDWAYFRVLFHRYDNFGYSPQRLLVIDINVLSVAPWRSPAALNSVYF